MRIRRKTLYGKIDGKGRLGFSQAVLDDFCRLFPNKNVIIRVEPQPEEPSEKLTNYFFGYIVKEMQSAMYESWELTSEEKVYNEIRRNCPLFLEEKRENGKWETRVKEWEELDLAEAVEVVSWVQQWAAEEFNWIIDDPR